MQIVLPIFLGGPIGSYLPGLGSCAGAIMLLACSLMAVGCGQLCLQLVVVGCLVVAGRVSARPPRLLACDDSLDESCTPKLEMMQFKSFVIHTLLGSMATSSNKFQLETSRNFRITFEKVHLNTLPTRIHTPRC